MPPWVPLRGHGLFSGILLASLILCGALGEPFLSSEVPFSAVEREHFGALVVSAERGAASSEPLVLRLNIVGDASDADLREPFAWLAENANIVVVRDPNGAPLFLTTRDLAATSGRGTLGATVSTGMAAEVDNPRVGPCVVAHEILHFVGLRHVSDRSNIMYQHCAPDFLHDAEIDDAQLAQLATVQAIHATTPSGVRGWAHRG